MIPPVTWSRATWAWLQVSLALLHPFLNITSYIPALSYQQCPMEFQFFYLSRLWPSGRMQLLLPTTTWHISAVGSASSSCRSSKRNNLWSRTTTRGAKRRRNTVTDFWVQQIHAELTLNFCGFQLFWSWKKINIWQIIPPPKKKNNERQVPFPRQNCHTPWECCGKKNLWEFLPSGTCFTSQLLQAECTLWSTSPRKSVGCSSRWRRCEFPKSGYFPMISMAARKREVLGHLFFLRIVF